MSQSAENNAPESQFAQPAGRSWRTRLRPVVGVAALAAIFIAGQRIVHIGSIYFDAYFRPAAAPISNAGRAAPPAFDLQGSIVDRREIHRGGPAKDGIPALTDPKFVSPANAAYLQPHHRVIGVAIGDDARAYPLPIMDFHEIVNDTIAGAAVAVTYCPLCDSAVVFDRKTPLGSKEFGVSGLLYNSNVLMYDRGGETEFLWSQLKKTGITGDAANQQLQTLPVELTTWEDWQSRYPRTRVLAYDTGYDWPYENGSPYAGYLDTPRIMFPVKPSSDRLPAKSPVLGVWAGESYRAYPQSVFDADHTTVTDELDGAELTIEFNPTANSLRVARADEGVEWMYSLWFAWYAMYPETTVYERPDAEGAPAE